MSVEKTVQCLALLIFHLLLEIIMINDYLQYSTSQQFGHSDSFIGFSVLGLFSTL